MPLRNGRLVTLVLVLALRSLACALPGEGKPPHGPADQRAGLQRLFRDIDTNHDGQLDDLETAQFAAASLDLHQEGWSAQAAQAASRAALDGPDPGATVSEAELAAHLVALLQDHRVEEWVSHGLNLPQHAAAFRAAAITALDFPFLVADGGASLAAELGVTSKLHQQQILRGLKRLILGLGAVPQPPRLLTCAAVNRSAVRLGWQPPAEPGHPPFHKYVLQRQRTTATGRDAAGGGPAAAEGRWEAVGEPDDEDTAWVDLPPAKGSYRYRLAAWSAFGHSAFALTDDGPGGGGAACQVRAVARRPSPPMQLAAAEVEALLAAVAAAGNGTAAGVHAHSGAKGGAWSLSAASSAAVVALTILLKASQLRVGGMLAMLCRRLAAQLPWLHSSPARGGSPSASAAEAPAAAAPAADTGRAAVADGVEPAALPGSCELRMGPPAGGGGMLRRVSGSKLLERVGEASGQMGSGLPAGLDAALPEAAFSPAEGNVDEELQLAVQRGARCAHPACDRRFDRLRDMRRRLESHYCRLCQRVYCLQHTRVSPHGPRGGCGLESQCVCHACFAELAPAQQAACERSNRLPKLAAAATDSASVQQAAAQLGLEGGPAPDSSGDAAQGGAFLQPVMEGCCSVPETLQQLRRAPSGRQLSAGAQAGPAAARKRWLKAGAALRAVLRLRAAASTSS